MEFLKRAVEDIKIYVARDAVDVSYIRVLPECPGTRVGKMIYIVVGNPVRIGIESIVAEVFLLKIMASVEDGLDTVILFYDIEPRLGRAPQLRNREVTGFLYIEYRREVASLKMYLLEEEVCLTGGINIRRKEVIGATDKSILMGLIDVVIEVLVNDAHALSGFDDNKPKGLSLDGGVAEDTPVDAVLIVTNVYATDIITIWIIRISVDGLPTE